MEELKPGVNTGVVEKGPEISDYVAGGETGAPAKIALDTGDWRPYLPTDEKQLFIVNGQSYLETNACVSFSGDNDMEIFGGYLIGKGEWPAESVQWLRDNGYFDANGKVNFSDRFTAKMSGTDPNGGNNLAKVWGSRRVDGLVPEASWPMPVEEMKQLIAQGGWTHQDVQNLYYKAVPQAIIDLGKAFAARFDIWYEWVAWPGSGATVDTFREALKVAPLQLATAVCAGWNTDDPIKACGAGTQHATAMVAVETDGRFVIYDHYNPFLKHFAADYTITYAMRGFITPKAAAPVPAPPPAFHYTFTKPLRYNFAANDPVELKALQQAMQYLKGSNGTPYMKQGVFGPYGPQTRDAMAVFQKDNHIVDPQPGEHFGPKSRDAMNAALTK